MTCNDKENMERFTGDSFRDLTRIARINDLMWSELFVANKDMLLEQMNLFIDKFNSLRDMLENEDIDGMRAMMRHSTERRALFDKK
jgi:prephenate dehydrogenase